MENEKKRIKLTHSLPAKVAAIMLMTLLSLCAVGFGFVLFLNIYGGYFSGAALDLSAFDNIADARGLVQFCYDARYASIYITAASLLASVVCLVFLCTSAGHRGESDAVRLNALDRIPLDLYFGAVVFGVIGLAVIVSDLYLWSNIYAIITICAVVGTLMVLLVLAFILTLATRIKMGRWWANTIIYRALRLCWRIIKGIWCWCVDTVRGISHGLPIVWRTALIMAGVLLAQTILSATGFSGINYGRGELSILLLVALDFIIFAAACFGALQMKNLKIAGAKLAAGELDYQIDTAKMYWEFKNHADDLNSIAAGMAAAVDSRMKSERLKTELITNVSHDIKTPLTSIVNYVDLLEKPHTQEQETEYLEVLSRQSSRLKKLTEDLVEASKASTGNLAVNLMPTNLTEVINQSIGEYSEKLDAGKLSVMANLPEPPVSAIADGRLLWRVMDNLLNNVCKYALAGTRVYIDVEKSDVSAVISVKNISRAALNISAEELMERFVRGDSSRNTEGSGLGLNIARSLVELQKGKLELFTDGDLFKAQIMLPLA